MRCPKCGREVSAGAFICPGCEYILDTSFLGDDITDDQREKRLPSRVGPGKTKSGEFGEDAIILGDGQGEYSDFSSRDAGGLTREVTQARFYIGGATAALLHPDAVPEITPGVLDTSLGLKMSPFEKHVIGFLNGKRSIARIQKKSAMEDSEFKVAVSMLADKGIIRLRTTKKKKNRSALSGGPSSRSESSRIAPSGGAEQSGGSERTVVASIDMPDFNPGASGPQLHPSMAAAAALDDDEQIPTRAEVRGSRASHSDATIIKGNEQKKSKLPGFASMRLQGDDDEAEARPARAPEKRADDWGDSDNPGNNISNVFARAQPEAAASSSSRIVARPSLADAHEPPPLPADDEPLINEDDQLLPPGDDDDDFFKKSRTGPQKKVTLNTAERDVPLGLRDPTGMGDLDDGGGFSDGRAEGSSSSARDRHSSDRALSFADEADIEADADAQASAEDRAAEEEPVDEEEDRGTEALRRPSTVHELATADRGVASDEPTGPLPDRDDEDDGADEPSQHDAADVRSQHDDADERSQQGGDDNGDDDADADADDDAADDDERPPLGDDEAEGFDVDLHTAARPDILSAQTASLPEPPQVLELPSDALQPLPSRVMQAPPVVVPPPVPRGPPQPLPSLAKPLGLPGQMGLPGQALQRGGTPAAPVRAPGGIGSIPKTGAGGVAPVRTSAGSKVGFEQARKAEKIFEQALKDHAEGRLSSARMNAKLAVMYDPSIETYADFLKELDAKGADAKPPGGGKSRELQLFEQASECEGKGDFEKAVNLLEEAVSINPKAAALRNRLGVVLSIRLKRHNEAMEQLKIAIDLEPGNIVYMNNFSKVTALLDSQLEKDPNERKKKGTLGEKIAIKKIRPKIF